MKRQLFVIVLILVAICPADEAARSDAETQSPEAPSSAAPLREQKSPIPWKTPTYTLVARDMDLRTALDTFAVAEGLSVVMSEGVQGVFPATSRTCRAGSSLNASARSTT
jgi:type II secretory pathway component GspD/PulD (secretin)